MRELTNEEKDLIVKALEAQLKKTSKSLDTAGRRYNEESDPGIKEVYRKRADHYRDTFKKLSALMDEFMR